MFPQIFIFHLEFRFYLEINWKFIIYYFIKRFQIYESQKIILNNFQYRFNFFVNFNFYKYKINFCSIIFLRLDKKLFQIAFLKNIKKLNLE